VHTKQRVTLVCIILSILVILGSLYAGLVPFALVSTSVALAWFVYRVIMRYMRSCPHCRIWWNVKTWLSTKRSYFIEPYRSPLSKVSLCTTTRTCGYRMCSHFGREEEAKPAYTKEFGKAHRRILQFAGLI